MHEQINSTLLFPVSTHEVIRFIPDDLETDAWVITAHNLNTLQSRRLASVSSNDLINNDTISSFALTGIDLKTNYFCDMLECDLLEAKSSHDTYIYNQQLYTANNTEMYRSDLFGHNQTRLELTLHPLRHVISFSADDIYYSDPEYTLMKYNTRTKQSEKIREQVSDFMIDTSGLIFASISDGTIYQMTATQTIPILYQQNVKGMILSDQNIYYLDIDFNLMKYQSIDNTTEQLAKQVIGFTRMETKIYAVTMYLEFIVLDDE